MHRRSESGAEGASSHHGCMIEDVDGETCRAVAVAG